MRLRREHPDFSSPNREDSEIVRLGTAGYYRRGASFVVFQVGATPSPLPGETPADKPAETPATASAPPTRVQLPPEAGPLHTLLTCGSVTVAESHVDFSGPGFAVLSPSKP